MDRRNERKTQEQLVQMCEDSRDDMNFVTKHSLADIEDMLGCVSRMRSMAEQGIGERLRDNTIFNASGTIKNYKTFRVNTTLLNLAQMAKLEKLNPGMDHLWSRSLQGRHFNHVNKEVGSELKKLIRDAEQGLVVPYDEARRWNLKRKEELRLYRDHRCKPALCTFWRGRTCQGGNSCSHLHMEQERNLGDRRIFGGDFD